jgi:hypothetical protein
LMTATTLSPRVMAGLVLAIHVQPNAERRGCPGHLRKDALCALAQA